MIYHNFFRRPTLSTIFKKSNINPLQRITHNYHNFFFKAGYTRKERNVIQSKKITFSSKKPKNT